MILLTYRKMDDAYRETRQKLCWDWDELWEFNKPKNIIYITSDRIDKLSDFCKYCNNIDVSIFLAIENNGL